MRKKYAVFVGDVAVDEYYKADRYPHLKEKILVDMLSPQMGGTIANAACVYASYGNETRFLSILNHNDRKLCYDLNKNNIRTDMIIFDDNIPDSKCIILLSEGEHTVLIVRRKFTMEISKSSQRQLCGASIIYSNYSELHSLRRGSVDACGVVSEWFASGVKLMCDVDVSGVDEETKKYLKYTHTLFMNETGFERQKHGRNDDEIVKSILDAGVKFFIVTLAEKGCVIYEKNRKIIIGGVSVPAIDVTGAGDTFCSSFTDFYNMSSDVELSGTFANYAAALSITKLGARSGAVGYDPILEFMRQRGVDVTRYIYIIEKNQK
jgi:ribokinase